MQLLSQISAHNENILKTIKTFNERNKRVEIKHLKIKWIIFSQYKQLGGTTTLGYKQKTIT
ncbi:hypothetical protein, partial [Shewanella sp. MBTL60-007]|uniref:hypothetical protein n=1 Tax=Shewanella sp. MBTL60-007 TaxID=2815911 RepID=UPI001C7FB3BF